MAIVFVMMTEPGWTGSITAAAVGAAIGAAAGARMARGERIAAKVQAAES